jgi:hypothetical protein
MIPAMIPEGRTARLLLRNRISTPALLILAMSSTACGPTNYFVSAVKIDAQQHIYPVGSKSLKHPNAGSYYMFFHGAYLTSINHLAFRLGTQDARGLFYMETNRNQILDRTVKDDEVLTGDFGAIVTEKTCFYNRNVENNPASVQVLIQSVDPDIGRELPDSLPKAPSNTPPVTSIALVRFFRQGAKLAFASGNYEASGELAAIHSGEILNGDLQPGSSVIFFTAGSEFQTLRSRYGLPPRVDIQSYMHSQRISLTETSLPDTRMVAVVVYGFGRLIRQDSIEKEAVVASRYLRSSVTEEERMLAPMCDHQLQQQQSSGKSTIW